MSNMKRWINLMESVCPVCGSTPCTCTRNESKCMECGTGTYMPMEQGTQCNQCGHMPSHVAGVSGPIVGEGDAFPVKEVKDTNNDAHWDEVEEKESCKPCGGSGNLVDRQTGDSGNCPSCGGTGVKSEYRRMEESEQVKESTKELKDWSVLYDNTHSNNVRARLRVEASMDESAVREWFSKTFQPLKIYEISSAVGGDVGTDTGRFPAFGRETSQTKPEFTVEYMSKDSPEVARYKNFSSREQLDNWYKTNENTITVLQARDSRGRPVDLKPKVYDEGNTTFVGGTPGPATVKPVKPGDTIVTVPKGKTVPAGLTAGDDTIVVKERETRSTDSDMSKIMTAVHNKLNGNYELAVQKKAMHRVARHNRLSYATVLGAWLERSDGAKKAVDAVKFAEKPTDSLPMAAPAAPVPTGAQMPMSEAAKRKLSLDESHAVHLEVDDHHEVRMAQADLYKTVKCATELHQILDNLSELEGWVQAKITLAADYIETVKDHLEYETMRVKHDMHSGFGSPDAAFDVMESKKSVKIKKKK